jgi:hypothetical protein
VKKLLERVSSVRLNASMVFGASKVLEMFATADFRILSSCVLPQNLQMTRRTVILSVVLPV